MNALNEEIIRMRELAGIKTVYPKNLEKDFLEELKSLKNGSINESVINENIKTLVQKYINKGLKTAAIISILISSLGLSQVEAQNVVKQSQNIEQTSNTGVVMAASKGDKQYIQGIVPGFYNIDASENISDISRINGGKEDSPEPEKINNQDSIRFFLKLNVSEGTVVKNITLSEETNKNMHLNINFDNSKASRGMSTVDVYVVLTNLSPGVYSLDDGKDNHMSFVVK